MRRTLGIFAVAVMASVGLLVGTGGAATAATGTSTASRMNAVLEKHPDAVRTGKEIITFSTGVQLRLGVAATGCPLENLCFWEHDDFLGEMLAVPGALCRRGRIFNFDAYDFNDLTSSYDDNSPSFSWYAEVYANYGATGEKIWEMLPTLPGRSVADRFNDSASSFYCEPF
jgi:hypothetical protein